MEINTFYNKDVLKEITNIPNNFVDLILTDPPYKLVPGGMKKSPLRHRPHSAFSDKGTILKTPKIEEWIFEHYRILKDGSYAFIFMGDRQIGELITLAQKAGFFYCQLLVMQKHTKVINPYFFKQCEFILLFRKGYYKPFTKFGDSNLIPVKIKTGKSKIHPTEKPLSILEKFIFLTTKEGQIVFDGFAGSASTLLAAKNLNRDYLGYEIEQKYWELGNKRLQED